MSVQQLKPQAEQVQQLTKTAGQVSDLTGQVASGVSQASGLVNTASSLGASGIPDTSGTAEAMSGSADSVTNAAGEAQPVELMSGPVPQDVPGGDAPAPADPPPPPPDPTINGPASAPVIEHVGDDLESSLPNTGRNVAGDPTVKPFYPTLDGNKNPLQFPKANMGLDGARPLPTGLATGPNGKQYAFYSTPMYKNPDGSMNLDYVTPNSAIVDLADPKKIIGNSPVAQTSGVYDPASNTMFLVGNPGDGHGYTRQLFQSDPIDPQNPNSWTTGGMHYIGDILQGNRESQLVALQGGGYLFVGSTDGGPIEAVAASTPQGLVGKTGVALVPESAGAGGVDGVYGPTILKDAFNASTGVHTLTMRVSQFWDPQHMYNEKGDIVYNPRTYTSIFTVTQPPTPAPAAAPRP